ncbi:MAG: glycosyltransferase family 4 protein [Anaerolineae bacterium]
MKPRVAVVVQRYGVEVNGGAEWAARWVAEHLGELTDVTVLTTCAKEYTTWVNEYPPGKTEVNGVPVRRFQVDAQRKWSKSKRETGRFFLQPHSLEEEIAWIKRQGPFSSGLFRHIYQSRDKYDVFFFFTYLYATTFFGLPLVAEKAVLVPTAHDEPFLYLDAYRALFHLPRHLLFLTESERDLVTAVTGATTIPSTVVGIGLEPPPKPPPATSLHHQAGLQERFLLYGGRISEGKNVSELLDYFLAYRQVSPIPLKLALMGRANIPLPDHPDVIPLGYLTEREKWSVISAAEVVIMPSKYESLSIIILEAWLMGRPVLVNGRCEVLRQQVRQSNGGLYYSSYDEFEAGLNLLLNSPVLRRQLGQQGQKFVSRTYAWENVLAQYGDIIRQVLGSSGKVTMKEECVDMA